MQFPQGPEIRVARPLDSALNGNGPAVVSRHGQVPVAEGLIQLLEVPSRRARRFRGVLTLVHPAVPLEAVKRACAEHELPDALGALVREREGVKGAFTGGEVDQVLRQPRLAQLVRDHLLVNAAALEHHLHIMPRVLLEQGNEAVDQVV